MTATWPVPTPSSRARPWEKRHDAARVADLVTEVEMVRLGVVEVDSSLDQPQTEHHVIEIALGSLAIAVTW